MSSMSLSCPFRCGYKSNEEYSLQLHIEELHTEDSPFVAELPASNDDLHLHQPTTQDNGRNGDDLSERHVECPNYDCGEVVLLSDYNEHLDFHDAERATLDEEQPGPSSSLTPPASGGRMHSSTGSSSDAHEGNFSHSIHPRLRPGSSKLKTPHKATPTSPSTSSIQRQTRQMQRIANERSSKKEPGRLGRHDLGPHAYEDEMPDWLWQKLSSGPKITKQISRSRDGTVITKETVENEQPGLIPVLAQLSRLDHNVTEAWLCHPSVIYVFAFPREGGFCGYRNVQMLVSYLQGSKAFGYEQFPGPLPSIPNLQDAIENAWDKGFNAEARRQTGGIKRTRKYIGTPEVQALFNSLHIPNRPEGISGTTIQEPYEALLDVVEQYFSSDMSDTEAGGDGRTDRVHRTSMAPIYLQQYGHSMTIVGLEKLRNGSRNLLVFDPMYNPSPALVNLARETSIRHSHPSAISLLRRDKAYLEKHKSFELVKLTANAPRIPAWGIIESFPHTQFAYVFFDLETDTYDVYAADAFKQTFPWFMFGGLFIVREGRFARVPGDASFDRLGVPALGVGCDWNRWKKNDDLTPLVLAATSIRQSRRDSTQEPFFNPADESHMMPPNIRPVPFSTQHLMQSCACTDCIGTAAHGWSQSHQLLGDSQYLQPTLAPLSEISPLLLTPACSIGTLCSCLECSRHALEMSNAQFHPHSSHERSRRRHYRRRHYEVAFPTARAFLNGGTPLSEASKAYIRSSPPSSAPSPYSDPLHNAPTPAHTLASPQLMAYSPASSPPRWTSSSGSPASSYGPVTPTSQYSQAVSGDSMAALLQLPDSQSSSDWAD